MDDSLMHGCRGHREYPCGEWISNICLRVDPYGMAPSANLDILRLLSDIAIDMPDTTLGSQARGRTGALKEPDGQF